ncbi:hypothetical protein VPBG_00125 [Vibrio phage helene 12B3]|uniref:hypothetical protein n=1 Tax=Vibrio phage helene 12B3 TaxID=573173 RepID=UPI0002C0C880|nr:hypothetical protein VPBG_00125 [Vibrio phage helene 12B3]YP_009222995.1 hypothetical protein VPLG_00146 [Vibrio phage eugene 12A10]AGG57897.1 hypothetical protein VPBG_00125 [Vibrio phage helene 12B3]AGN51585.1 hypothetical protein VPLG_00146 [Vibrio phage eugene 12A10]
MKTKMLSEIKGQFNVTLQQQGKTYYVQYGEELTIHKELITALNEFKACQEYQLECAGFFL